MSSAGTGYYRALKLEYYRNRKRRMTRQGGLESKILSLERLLDEFDDPSEIAAFTDNYVGVDRVLATCDGEDTLGYYQNCARRALYRVRDRPNLCFTLKLVIKNGSRREDSIWAILEAGISPNWDAARKRYFYDVEKLLKIFCGQCLQGSNRCSGG